MADSSRPADSAAASASDAARAPEAVIPVELPGGTPGRGGWLSACVRTLLRTVAQPWSSFRRTPEPIAHGRALGYLATLRLPPWAVLMGLQAMRLASDHTPPLPLRSIHTLLDPPFVQALSAWQVLMVPVGLPLSYFFGGLLAHVGIALTGGATRSIGASMRAVGYAAGPTLLAIGLLDLPLYLGDMPSEIYLPAAAIAIAPLLVLGGISLARTHQFSLLRGLLVMIWPVLLVLLEVLLRAALVLRTLPGLDVPDQPYYVP